MSIIICRYVTLKVTKNVLKPKFILTQREPFTSTSEVMFIKLSTVVGIIIEKFSL